MTTGSGVGLGYGAEVAADYFLPKQMDPNVRELYVGLIGIGGGIAGGMAGSAVGGRCRVGIKMEVTRGSANGIPTNAASGTILNGDAPAPSASATDSPMAAPQELLGPNPTGPDVFSQVARHPGSQQQKATYFELLAKELKAKTQWTAEKMGVADDGSIIWRGEKQPKALVISPEGKVFTGTWGKQIKVLPVNGQPTLVVDWDMPGWKEWK